MFECASLSSLREMSNSLWSLSKELALNKKLLICTISEKEDNLVRNTQIFQHFPWKFRYYLSLFRKFRNFMSYGKLPSFGRNSVKSSGTNYQSKAINKFTSWKLRIYCLRTNSRYSFSIRLLISFFHSWTSPPLLVACHPQAVFFPRHI